MKAPNNVFVKSAWTAIEKYHRLDGLRSIPYNIRGGEVKISIGQCKIKMRAD
jgi:hypothetical protein